MICWEQIYLKMAVQTTLNRNLAILAALLEIYPRTLDLESSSLSNLIWVISVQEQVDVAVRTGTVHSAIAYNKCDIIGDIIYDFNCSFKFWYPLWFLDRVWYHNIVSHYDCDITYDSCLLGTVSAYTQKDSWNSSRLYEVNSGFVTDRANPEQCLSRRWRLSGWSIWLMQGPGLRRQRNTAGMLLQEDSTEQNERSHMISHMISQWYHNLWYHNITVWCPCQIDCMISHRIWYHSYAMLSLIYLWYTMRLYDIMTNTMKCGELSKPGKWKKRTIPIVLPSGCAAAARRQHQAKQDSGYIGREGSLPLLYSAYIRPAWSRDAAQWASENPYCYSMISYSLSWCHSWSMHDLSSGILTTWTG